MKRLVKQNYFERLCAVQNMPSPYTDQDCLNELKNAGYEYVLNENEYRRNGTGGKDIGYYGFYSKQALTKEEKEKIEFPIIFYNEIYSFTEINTGHYKTFLISWPHDINGQMISDKENVTPDKLIRRKPIITEYNNVSPGEVKRKFSDKAGDTINSYAVIGNYKSFDEALESITNK